MALHNARLDGREGVLLLQELQHRRFRRDESRGRICRHVRLAADILCPTGSPEGLKRLEVHDGPDQATGPREHRVLPPTHERLAGNGERQVGILEPDMVVGEVILHPSPEDPTHPAGALHPAQEHQSFGQKRVEDQKHVLGSHAETPPALAVGACEVGTDLVQLLLGDPGTAIENQASQRLLVIGIRLRRHRLPKPRRVVSRSSSLDASIRCTQVLTSSPQNDIEVLATVLPEKYKSVYRKTILAPQPFINTIFNNSTINTILKTRVFLQFCSKISVSWIK